MVGAAGDAMRQVDEDSWLIDEKLLLHRSQTMLASNYLWKDEAGYYYTMLLGPTPIPTATPLSSDGFPKKIYEMGWHYRSVVFDLGDALLKVKDRHPKFSSQDLTPEPVTLRWLADKTLSFPIPKILFHIEDATRIYSIVSRVPGKSIDEEWRHLNEEQKQHCVTRVARICQELSVWTSDSITGVDCNRMFDPWLDLEAEELDLSAANLLRNCQDLGMDTSKLVFSHNDLGPTNVMSDVDNDCNIGVVDWERAGFVPPAWVRTKFAACWAGDFNGKPEDKHGPWVNEWRLRVAKELGSLGLPVVEEEFRSWVNEHRARKGMTVFI